MPPPDNDVRPGDLVRIWQSIPLNKIGQAYGRHVGEGLLLDSYVNQPTDSAGAYFNFYEVLWDGNIRQLNGLDYSLVRINDV